ncbi:MAG: pyruvate ferredoxin oxidoreductase [Methanoregulaceae archaeon]|nr:pyruvate ferredoxin oxidoreductase [Methanoregulaceae archaeon]
MTDLSVLVGGKAGDGINSAGLIVSHLFNQFGYYTYMYFDYPSLIKGGHNYTITRAADRPVGATTDHVDFVLALNQDSLDLHRDLFSEKTVIVYDSSRVKSGGQGVDITAVLKEEEAPPVMGNSCIIGAFAGAAGIPFPVLEEVFSRQIPKGLEKNLAVARKGFRKVSEVRKVPRGNVKPTPLLSGNEAIGIGLLLGGLEAYIAYPMTPTSNLLHFLAGAAEQFPLTVVHPENEISVILMAHGLAYGGKKTAVGTSGGGFCLMTESFSMAGMNEEPIVVVMGQRTGPSTGLPTYTGQSDLHFILHAGQGEFPRFIVAPGDAGQAVFWSQAALSLAWKCQVPAVILVDKTLCEGTFSLWEDLPEMAESADLSPGDLPYQRYAITDSGISPLRFPPTQGAAIKSNSYVHDENGLTTERADLVVAMTEKRLRKGATLKKETDLLPAVNVSGDAGAERTLLCWGSTLPVCRELADRERLRLVQPVVLSPFPEEALRQALAGSKKIILVEENVLGQLQMLCARHGIRADHAVRRYDGRPFSVDGLWARIREVA